MNVSSVTTYCDLVLFYSNLCFTLCGLPIQNSEEPKIIVSGAIVVQLAWKGCTALSSNSKSEPYTELVEGLYPLSYGCVCKTIIL